MAIKPEDDGGGGDYGGLDPVAGGSSAMRFNVGGGHGNYRMPVGRTAPVQVPVSKAPRSRQFKPAVNPKHYYPGEKGKFLSGEEALSTLKEATHYSNNPNLHNELEPHLPGHPALREWKDYAGTFFGTGVKGDSLGGFRYGRHLYKPEIPDNIKTDILTGKKKVGLGLHVRDLATAQKHLDDGIIGTHHPHAPEDIFWAFGMHPDFKLSKVGEAVPYGHLPTGMAASKATEADLGGYRLAGKPETKLSREQMQAAIDNKPLEDYLPKKPARFLRGRRGA
jgi:hypothetical protein